MVELKTKWKLKTKTQNSETENVLKRIAFFSFRFFLRGKIKKRRV